MCEQFIPVLNGRSIEDASQSQATGAKPVCVCVRVAMRHEKGRNRREGGSCSYSNRGRFVIVVALNHELPILSAMCLSLLDRSTDICNVIRGYLGLLDWFTATHSCTQELPFMENSSMCANQS
jgi:hypothetical protein